MRKNNEQGFTLVEVLASITILSIITVGIFTIFPKSYYSIKQSQAKLVSVNIARGALHYVAKIDYDTLNNYLASLGDGKVAIFDTADSCNTTYSVPNSTNPSTPIFLDQMSCTKIITPTINNITYTNRNVQIFIVPSNYSDSNMQAILNYIQAVHPKTVWKTVPTTLKTMMQSDAASMQTSSAYTPLHVFVYVDLNETDDTEGLVLEGSVAHDSIR